MYRVMMEVPARLYMFTAINALIYRSASRKLDFAYCVPSVAFQRALRMKAKNTNTK